MQSDKFRSQYTLATDKNKTWSRFSGGNSALQVCLGNGARNMVGVGINVLHLYIHEINVLDLNMHEINVLDLNIREINALTARFKYA